VNQPTTSSFVFDDVIAVRTMNQKPVDPLTTGSQDSLLQPVYPGTSLIDDLIPFNPSICSTSQSRDSALDLSEENLSTPPYSVTGIDRSSTLTSKSLMRFVISFVND
jgi:hypothetical protein